MTMCPHGYHHNGFMETPALGTQEVRFTLFGLHCEVTRVHQTPSKKVDITTN